MRAGWMIIRFDLPGSPGLALLLAGGFALFTSWDQSPWCRVEQDDAFVWLVTLSVAFVVLDRWANTRAAAAACALPNRPRAAEWQGRLLATLTGSTLLLLGAAFFLLDSCSRAGASTFPTGTLAITLGIAGITLALLVLNARPSPSTTPGGLTADSRLRLARLGLFPALIWLVSAPMFSAAESQLTLVLLRRAVAVMAFAFDALGLPIEPCGNVLALPPVSGQTNRVGVEGACSGIRSLTACLCAGSFLWALFVQRTSKKVALVVAALLLAFATSLAHSSLLRAWACGYAAIEGTVRDVARYAGLGGTVLGLLGLLPLLNLRLQPAGRPPPAAPSP